MPNADDLRTMVEVRPIAPEDAPVISSAFAGGLGWYKPEAQFLTYVREEVEGARFVRVATVHSGFAGYITVLRKSGYPPFRDAAIPEIQDLNVLPEFRNQGIGTRLLDEAENWIAARSAMAGIGVGLHPGYNAALRLYINRGYVPDGRGITYNLVYVREGEKVQLDDELVLWLTRNLK